MVLAHVMKAASKRAASLGWGFAALAAGLPGCCCGGCCRATRTPDQQQQHKRAPSLGGASLRSPLRLSGSPAAVAAAAMPQPARTKAGPTKRQQHSSTTKEQLLWGGASLRSPMRLSGCCCRATRTPDQQQQHKRAASLGWGFATLAAGHAGEESRRQHNHQHIGGFCPRRCRR